jgi:hypothetical protein
MKSTYADSIEEAREMGIVTSRWAIKRVVDKGGVYRNRGGTQLIPDNLESEITQRVLELRALKHPVYK